MSKPEAKSPTLIAEQISSVKSESHYLHDQPPVFLFTNDKGIRRFVSAAVTHTEAIDHSFKIGLVVGPTGILSFSKELEAIDLWISLDYNPQVLQWLKATHHLVKQEPKAGIYQSKLIQRVNQLQPFLYDKADQYLLLENERVSFGDYHYLASQKSYEKAREAVRRKPVAYVAGNVEDPNFLKEFGNSIRQVGGVIAFADMTNVMGVLSSRKTREFQTAFTSLPFHDRAFMLHSDWDLQCNTAQGVHDYVEASIESRMRNIRSVV